MCVFMQFNADRAHSTLNLAQFNNLSLNFVSFGKHSAQKLSKTIGADPCGALIVNELKRENVSIRVSYYALPISYLKGQTVLGQGKTPKPPSAFGADFAVHYGRYGLRLAAFWTWLRHARRYYHQLTGFDFTNWLRCSHAAALIS